MRSTFIVGVALVAMLGACARSPTGRQQLILVPDAEMNSLGAQTFQQLKAEQPQEDDPRVRSYVQCVARNITSVLEGGQEWEVRVFESEEVNAFALPGGKIGVFSGMLEVARDEDQLAAVIGHEVSHVLARHGSERVSQALAVQGGLVALDVALADARQRDLILGALGLGATVGVLLPFSRTQESEADDMGLTLMSHAGFDPRAAVQLWRNMQAAAGGQPPQFLSTHPSHETRIRDLRAQMSGALDNYTQARARGRVPRCEPPRQEQARAGGEISQPVQPVESGREN